VPLADHLVELAAQPAVVQHLQVRLEDGAVLFAELLGDRIAIVGDFLAGRGDCLFQAAELFVHGVARNEPARDAKSLAVHHQRFTDGHARRNGNSL
jgi:hypothetical protein